METNDSEMNEQKRRKVIETKVSKCKVLKLKQPKDEEFAS